MVWSFQRSISSFSSKSVVRVQGTMRVLCPRVWTSLTAFWRKRLWAAAFTSAFLGATTRPLQPQALCCAACSVYKAPGSLYPIPLVAPMESLLLYLTSAEKSPPTKTLPSLSDRIPKDLSPRDSSYTSDNVMNFGNDIKKKFNRQVQISLETVHFWKAEFIPVSFSLHRAHGPEYDFHWCWLSWWAKLVIPKN